jgi:hypothetical protein
MSKINDGGPAFPSKMLVNRFATKETAQQLIGADGMTVRDWFAGHAPTLEIEAIIGGSVSSVSEFIGIAINDYNYQLHYLQACTKARYQWADAMLIARNSKTQSS